ncbi:MAG: cation diffusion facilitator family transporter [Oscillospiraceae bacterium]|nr:cation diffusion facilitator family transporter [Oscillospiraceae bacterium]MDD6503358.1 cation diffusion facilitator family transporter [Oscillospiraceae bacterium]MDY4105237.1 cation diffusion facilitator family transporter [Oscillospiraceae bacterium]
MTGLLLRKFVRNYENTGDPAVRDAVGRLSGIVGILCNVLLFAAKFLAGTLTGSVAITADAINNLSDASSSVVTLLGFKLASKPADEKHPYGYARIEYMAGLIVAGIILIIGYSLAQTSIEKIRHPETIEFSALSIAILVGSILMKLWMSRFNTILGNHIHSTTLLATAADSRNDVISTGTVLCACILAKSTGIIADGWMGLAVAVFILCSGIGIARDTISPLLGEVPDPELIHHIHDTMMARPEVLGVHDLVVHDYGPGRIFATAHAEMDSRADVMESHEVIDELEAQFRREDHLEVTIHYDPIVTDDPEMNGLRSKVHDALKAIDPRLEMHDVRMVKGERHTNLIFDVLLPFDMVGRQAEIKQASQDAIHSDTHQYFTVINFDLDLAGKNRKDF